MQKRFTARFAHRNINLPKQDVEPRRAGEIRPAGWMIRYMLGVANDREYLEYYAMHRMTDDTHTRLWTSGEVDELDALWSMFVVGREQEYNEHNARVHAELTEKGLLP